MCTCVWRVECTHADRFSSSPAFAHLRLKTSCWDDASFTAVAAFCLCTAASLASPIRLSQSRFRCSCFLASSAFAAFAASAAASAALALRSLSLSASAIEMSSRPHASVFTCATSADDPGGG